MNRTRRPLPRSFITRAGRFAVGVGPVLALALTATALSSTPAAAVAAADKPAAASTPVTSRPDMYSAQVAAASQGTGVEVNNLGDHYTKVVANPDGTLTKTITPEPSRVQQADKSWADIDTTLTNTGGVVKPTQPGAAVVLSAGGGTTAASVTVAAKSLGAAAAGMNGSADAPGVDPNPTGALASAALNWPTALPAPALVDNVATYADAAAGMDLKVAALATGFETSVVIKTRPTGPVTIALPYNLSGLRMGVAPADEGAGVQLFDAKDRLVGQGGSAIASDDTTDPASGDPLHQAQVGLSVSGSGASTVLHLNVPASLLSDPGTVFPVTIDPAVNILAGMDTFVESSYAGVNFGSANFLKVGTFNGSSVARSYLAFPGSSIQNGVVNSAQLALWNWWTASCHPRTMMVYPVATGRWWGSKMTWNGNTTQTRQPGLYKSPSASVSAANGWTGCPKQDWMGGGTNFINVTSIAQAWAAGSIPNDGLGLKAANERDPLSWWQLHSSRWGSVGLRPQLKINYTTYPSTASNLSVGGISADGWVSTLTPTLTATPNSPDGGTCTANFQVLSGGTVVWSGSSAPGPCGQPQSVTVPTGVLGPLTQYQWRVNSAAGGLTSELATSGPAFRADAQAPGTVTITNPTFNNAAWNPTVAAGAATAFTIAHAAEDTDVVAYRTSFDGGPASTVAAAGANGSGTWGWTITPGWHELAAQGVDHSGNVSPIVARFDFGAAGAAMNGSHIDARSASTFPITATAPAPANTADVQYLNPATGVWASAPGTFATSTGGEWSNNTPGNTTTAGAMVSLSAVPVLWAPDPTTFTRPSIITIRVCLREGDGAPNCTATRQLQWVAHAFGGNFATTPAGPGTLALSTGELAVGATDATLPGTGISAGRTWLSLGNTTPGIFGPGWAGSLPAAGSAAAASQVVYDGAQNMIALNHPDGSTSLYQYGGTPDPAGDQVFNGSGLTAQDGSSVVLNQSRTVLSFLSPSGASTTWAVTSAGSGGLSFTVTADTAPLLGGSVGYATHAPTSSADALIYYTATGRYLSGATATNCSTDPVGALGRRGCQVMAVVLSPGNTPAPSGTGAYANQVDHINATVWDPTTSTMLTKTLAQYEYTGTGLLAAEWNPQLTPLSAGALKTVYTYTGTGADLVLASVAPPSSDGSLAAFSFGYEPSVTGRLLQVSRPAPSGGSAVTNIFYGLNLTGPAGLPVMDPGTVAAWGQDWNNAPASGVGVFYPNPDHAWAGSASDPGEADWPYASLTYLNNLGAPVNSASYGAGAWQIATTQYDLLGEVTSTLSAGNRAAALPEPGANCSLPPIVCATTNDPAARAGLLSSKIAYDRDHPGVVTDTWAPTTAVPASTLPAASTTSGAKHPTAVGRAATSSPRARSTAAPTKAAAKTKRCAKACKAARKRAAKAAAAARKAKLAASRRTKACAKHPAKCRAKTGPKPLAPPASTPANPAPPVGPPAGADTQMMLDAPPAPPAHAAAAAPSETGQASVRGHTQNTYNQGLPANLAATFAAAGTQLITTSVAGLAVVDVGGPGADVDVHTKTTGYGPITTGSASGWVLRQPTTATVGMNGDGPDLVSQVVYDNFGHAVQTRPPSDTAGVTAATTNSVFYTADTSATLPACDSHPEWEGAACQAGPAAQPTGGTSLPNTRVSSFDWFTNPLTMSNLSAAGASLRSTTNTYDTAGRASGSTITSVLKADTQVPATITAYAPNTGLPVSVTAGGKSVVTGFDSWAQPTSYTDAGGNAASTTFDVAGRVSTHSDGKGTYTYGYDTPTEHRGLLTSEQVGLGAGLPGDFTLTYDAEGDPAALSYPNGVTSNLSFNTVGALTGKAYTDSAGKPILSWSLQRDGWGRVVDETGPASGGSRDTGFSYDQAGRLSTVTDRLGTVCAQRGYGFDTASDRLTKTVTVGVSAACGSGPNLFTMASTKTTGVFNTASQLGSTTVTGTSTGTADPLLAAAGSLGLTQPGTGSYTYDTLGRTTSLPAIDTNNPSGDNVELAYYATDQVATQTVGATAQSWGLDPTGRTDTTTTTTGASSSTTLSHFSDASDSPAWTSTSTGAWTRFIAGPGGALALQATGTGAGTDATSANLMLINPHGDIAASIPNTANVTAAAVSAINTTDEYGVVLSTPAPSPYGWVGAAQRSTADQGGIILMGARQYNPATGRFLSLDPAPGGNPNPYTYPPDPVNASDLSGAWPDWLNNVISAVTAPVRAVVNLAHTVISNVTCWTGEAIHWVAHTARTAWRGAQRVWHSAADAIRRHVIDPIKHGIHWVSDHKAQIGKALSWVSSISGIIGIFCPAFLVVSAVTGAAAAVIDYSEHNYVGMGLDLVGAVGGAVGIGFKVVGMASHLADAADSVATMAAPTWKFGMDMAAASTHFLGLAGSIEGQFS